MVVHEEEDECVSDAKRPKSQVEADMPKLFDVDIDAWCIPVSIFLGVLVKEL